jgi:hypothetical protein
MGDGPDLRITREGASNDGVYRRNNTQTVTPLKICSPLSLVCPVTQEREERGEELVCLLVPNPKHSHAW